MTKQVERVPGVSIKLGEQTYRGLWFQHAPGMIELRSEYGARQVCLDGRDPGSVAMDVLSDIVALYRGVPTPPAPTDRRDDLDLRNLGG